jgi:uncharacterized protein
MEYITRHISEKLHKIFSTFPVMIVTGARQVGKTTLLRRHFPQCEYIEFGPVVDVKNARTDPELFLDNHPPPLILDEIQYVPELIPVIKRRISEDKRPGQYILTGSQQWEVIKNISESLAGRAIIIDMYGFDISEFSNTKEDRNGKNWLARFLQNSGKFLSSDYEIEPLPVTLTELLYRGFLPEAKFLPLELIYNFHNSYIRTYIERDVRLLRNIEDHAQFARFFKLTAALSGQEINYSKLGKDIGVTPATGKKWLSILNATYQHIEITPFSLNTVKKISSKPKGIISDSGLMCHSLVISSPDGILQNPAWGHLFESMVIMDIIKKINMLPFKPAVFHWRSHSGAEIDLLLELDGKFYPIEIKSKSRPSRRDTTGITAFRKTYPQLTIMPGLVIAPTDKILKISDNDYAVPYNLR